jgi:hypothetical protein
MKLLLLFLLTTLSATAQDYAWVRQIGGPGRDAAGEIVVDAAGYSYVTGSFQTSIRLGGTTHSSAGGFDLFIAKYSPDGAVVWSVRAGGSGDDAGRSIALAPDGGIYVSGTFQQTALFGTASLSADGTGADADGFIAHYASDGVPIWVKKTGSHASQGAPVIAVGAGGALYLAASFSGSVTLAGNTFTTSASSLRDIFVARYTAAGDVDWGRHVKAGRTATVKSIVAGSDGVYLSGTYTDTLTLGTTVLAPLLFEDLFVGHYSPEGDFKWARSVVGRYFETTAGVTLDGLGNSYIAGTYSDTMSIGSAGLRGNRSGTDIFLAKLDGDGDVVWLKGGSGGASDMAYDIASDSLGNLFMTGTFSDSLRFDQELLKSPGRALPAMFVARFLPTGELDYAVVGAGLVLGRSIALDADRNVMLTGEFGGQPGFRGFPMESSDSADLYVGKLIRTTPGAPKLTSPPYESEYLLPTTAFRWNQLPEATRYELQFAPDSTFALGMLSQFSDRSSTTVPFLQDSSKYYWRVRGYIGEKPGAWSKIWWFTTREQNLVNDFRWLDTTGVTTLDIATDRAGNSYVIGLQREAKSVIAGDTVRLFEGVHYIAKIDPSGRAQWASGIKGTSSADTRPIICIDSSGGVIMASDFSGARTIGGTTIGGSGRSTFYMARIKGEGVVDWVVAPVPAATGFNITYIRDMAADRAGNIYITGQMYGTVAFGSHVINNNRATGGMLFVAKYSPTGEALWVKGSQGDAFIYGTGIAVEPDGSLYVGGEFMDTLEIGGTRLRARYLDQPVDYMLRFETDGTFKWGQTAGSGGDLGQFGGVSVDRQGNGFLAGNYSDYATFGGVGGSPIDTIRSVGTGSSFLAKYAPDGAVIFAKAIGGGITRADQLVVDIDGNAYIGGTYTNYAHFEGGTPRRNDNAYNLFVKKVDPDGMPRWIATVAGWIDTTWVSPYGLGVDTAGNAYVVGNWVGYPHFGIFELARRMSGGGFITKIGDPGSAPYAVIAPLDGATEQNRSLLLVWAPVPGAISYDLEVSERSDFSSTFRRENELTATEYLLTGLALDRPYYWRVKANMGSSSLEWSEIWRFTTRLKDSATGVRTQPGRASSGTLELSAAPNPFSARSIVSYTLAEPGNIRIELFDPSGRSFGSVFEGRMEKGAHAMTIDRSSLVPGIYFIRVSAGVAVETIEVIVQ